MLLMLGLFRIHVMHSADVMTIQVADVGLFWHLVPFRLLRAHVKGVHVWSGHVIQDLVRVDCGMACKRIRSVMKTLKACRRRCKDGL